MHYIVGPVTRCLALFDLIEDLNDCDVVKPIYPAVVPGNCMGASPAYDKLLNGVAIGFLDHLLPHLEHYDEYLEENEAQDKHRNTVIVGARWVKRSARTSRTELYVVFDDAPEHWKQEADLIIPSDNLTEAASILWTWFLIHTTVDTHSHSGMYGAFIILEIGKRYEYAVDIIRQIERVRFPDL